MVRGREQGGNRQDLKASLVVPQGAWGHLGGLRGALGSPCGAPTTTTTTGVGGAGGRADKAGGKLAGIVTDKGHIREVVKNPKILMNLRFFVRFRL